MNSTTRTSQSSSSLNAFITMVSSSSLTTAIPHSSHGTVSSLIKAWSTSLWFWSVFSNTLSNSSSSHLSKESGFLHSFSASAWSSQVTSSDLVRSSVRKAISTTLYKSVAVRTTSLLPQASTGNSSRKTQGNSEHFVDSQDIRAISVGLSSVLGIKYNYRITLVYSHILSLLTSSSLRGSGRTYSCMWWLMVFVGKKRCCWCISLEMIIGGIRRRHRY